MNLVLRRGRPLLKEVWVGRKALEGYLKCCTCQLNGEEFQGLTIKELQKLEELLQRHWTTISKIKGPRSKDRRY
ncbi:hypothetical protein D0Y65_009815 [Glycine soja]|uniref:K-box domain-containing protein n=1 Tax=Glycine soja TaxID=3848 RepID=A0A445L0L3_GLYSO|nr:hypothetical protein D0Y65_009815 [Glycine soja]